MSTIWKYTLPTNQEKVSLEVPMLYADEERCLVGVQNGFPTLWVRVDPDSPKRVINIQMFETGSNCPKEGYLGTVLLLNDSLVLHVFLVN